MSILQSVRGRFFDNPDPIRTERYLELAVIVLLILLLLQLAYSGWRALTPAAVVSVSPAADALEPEPIFMPGQITGSQSEAIQARPLFWSSRRPIDAATGQPVQPVNTQKASPGKLKGVKVVGIYGADQSAGIIALEGSKLLRVSIGQELKGWKLKSVSAGSVVFHKGGAKETLALGRKAASASVTTTTIATPAPAKIDQAPSSKVDKPPKEEEILSFGGG